MKIERKNDELVGLCQKNPTITRYSTITR